MYFCSTFKDVGKKKPVTRYIEFGQDCDIDEHLYKKHIRFDFHDNLKWYLRDVTKGEVADDDPPSDAIDVDSESFVKFVVRHLDEAL